MPAPQAWQPARARVQLKLAIQRVRLLQQKRTQLAKQTRREVASQLEKGKQESARIKVEGLLSEDLYVELLEVLELYCELLLARFGLLETIKEVDPGVQEAVAGLIHAAPRTELKELHVLREMLMSKGGRDFAIACVDNIDNVVPDRVTSKLIVAPPAPELIDLYLFEIAKAYSVEWRPQGFPDPNAPVEELAPPSAAGVPNAVSIITSATPSTAATTSTGSQPPQTPTKPHSIPPFDAPSMPLTPPVEPGNAKDVVVAKTNLPAASSSAAPSLPPPAAAANGAASSGGLGPAPVKPKEDEFDALRKRFEDLKKR
ncbi:hypothetical protein JCM11641_000421 [Rhodosporidiobolus odoratus]